jgi:hypothetical protein
MDIKLVNLTMEISLCPEYIDNPPEILIKVNDNVLYGGQLLTTTTFDYSIITQPTSHVLTIEFCNASNTTSVVIDSITFNKIAGPEFVWAGNYAPIYPEPWATEQLQQGHILAPSLKYCNYLGWNGVWTLNFTTPIFTWIHKIKNLGWIYD